MNQTAEPDNNARDAWYWLKFALLTSALAAIVYYFTYGALIYSLPINDVRDFLNLNRPFSGEKIIAGIGTFAIIWSMVRSKLFGSRYTVSAIFKRWPLLYFLLAVFLFFFCFFVIFLPDEGAVRYQTIGSPMEKVLVENGYCGEERVYVPKLGARPCNEKTRAVIYTIGFIAGGEELAVYGVSDPNVLHQVKLAYVNAFLNTPELKHVIVYFDPYPWSQAESLAKDAFLEMRRE